MRKDSNHKEGQEKENPPKKPPLNNYIKYSALGFQMLAIIGGGAWLGVYLDGRNEMDFPIYTVVITLAAVFIALYLTLRDFIN